MKWALSRKNLWDKLNPKIKTSLAVVLGRLPPHYLLGKDFRNNVRFLSQAQHWSRQQSSLYQLAQLRRVCLIAYQKTAFYRRMFDSVGFNPDQLKTPQDLASLPVIDKDTVREHLDQMCTISPRRADVDFVSTGGTSGTPLHFYMSSARSAIEYAYLFTSWQRAGYKLDTPMAVFRGRVVPQDNKAIHHQYDPLLRHHYYSTFHLTERNIQRYLQHVAQLGPCFLHVYPSSVDVLARFIRRSNTKAPANILGIIAESEIVYPDQRKLAQEVFSCRYFSCYGQTEKLVLAAECEHSSDYHVWPTYGYFELLDQEDQPISKVGQRGQIVATGFIDTVVPFIRYRTGDYATYLSDRCQACGREHIIIDDIRGHRIQEVLVAADGAEISWTAINMHDDTFMSVQQFQFYQDTPGQAILRIVPAESFDQQDQQRIIRNLDRKLSGRVKLSIELTQEIPLSPRGKAIYVDQQIPCRPADSTIRQDAQLPDRPEVGQ